MPTPAELFASLLFGLIGSVAFMYGKKNMQWKAMLVGGLLVLLPWFVSDVRLIYVLGIALCGSLYFFRD